MLTGSCWRTGWTLTTHWCGKVSAPNEIFKYKIQLSEHRIWLKAHLLLIQTLIRHHKTWLVHLFHKNPSITNTTHQLLPFPKTPRFLAYTVFSPRFVISQGHKCSGNSLWHVDCSQQLSTCTTTPLPTLPSGWWREMEEQTQKVLASKNNLTREGTRRKKFPSDTDNPSPPPTSRSVCSQSANHGCFEKSPPGFIAEHGILYMISLLSIWISCCSFVSSLLSTSGWLLVMQSEKQRKPWCCVNPAQQQLKHWCVTKTSQIQNTAPCGLLWRKSSPF